MKVINVNDKAYQVLNSYPYDSEYNIKVCEKTTEYDIITRHDDYGLVLFCDLIEDAEFTEVASEKLKPPTKKKPTRKSITGTKRPSMRKTHKKKV